MINILDFSKNHIEQAKEIALMNYNEEKAIVNELPPIDMAPDLKCFADNGLGAAAFNGNKMIGFLCCYEPWDNAFDSTAKGTFSPIHAHGAIYENRGVIYKRLYQAAAKKWVKRKITYHAVALYAHDTQAVQAFFTYGFGLRCIDAIRPLTALICKPCKGISFSELEKTEITKVRKMRIMLSNHMSESPCFIYPSSDWLSRAESRDSRIFVAKQAEKIIAFIEIAENGETFATEVKGMKNICGAFCLPEYRGKEIIQNLLNYMMDKLKAEGYDRLGVDFESINPAANGFWLKHFTAYTNSVTRRIDECALRNEK